MSSVNFYDYELIWMNFQKLFSKIRVDTVLINLINKNDIIFMLPSPFFKIVMIDLFGNYKPISTKFSEISVLSGE